MQEGLFMFKCYLILVLLRIRNSVFKLESIKINKIFIDIFNKTLGYIINITYLCIVD